MPIDPARLARIRARVLAAATLAMPACGGSQETINRAREDPPNINEPPAEPKPVDGPINERVVDPPPTAPTAPNVNTPEPKHINTPPPLPTLAAPSDEPHINRPKPDTNPGKTPSPKDIPPPGQTINVVEADPRAPPPHINTAAPTPPNPPPAAKK